MFKVGQLNFTLTDQECQIKSEGLQLTFACNQFNDSGTPSERLEKLLHDLSVSNEPRDVQFVSQATDRGFLAPVNHNLSMFGVSATTPEPGNRDSSASEEESVIF